MDADNSNKIMISGSLLLLLAGIALLGLLFAGCTSQTQGTGKNGTPSVNAGTKIDAETKTGVEKTQETIKKAVADGTYSAQKEYNVPIGSETVGFEITVKDDIVTAVSVDTGMLKEDKSKAIAGGFKDALPELVVGKKITELNLPINVAGSSLTTAAFKAYVNELIETK